MNVLDTVSADDLGVNLLLAGKDGLTDARDINEVTCLVIERCVLGNSERNDTPVDTVAAITLGSILIADVRVAAEHLLARSSLLTCRTVTRLVGEHAGTERCIPSIGTNLRESIKNVLWSLSCATVKIL